MAAHSPALVHPPIGAGPTMHSSVPGRSSALRSHTGASPVAVAAMHDLLSIASEAAAQLPESAVSRLESQQTTSDQPTSDGPPKGQSTQRRMPPHLNAPAPRHTRATQRAKHPESDEEGESSSLPGRHAHDISPSKQAELESLRASYRAAKVTQQSLLMRISNLQGGMHAADDLMQQAEAEPKDEPEAATHAASSANVEIESTWTNGADTAARGSPMDTSDTNAVKGEPMEEEAAAAKEATQPTVSSVGQIAAATRKARQSLDAVLDTPLHVRSLRTRPSKPKYVEREEEDSDSDARDSQRPDDDDERRSTPSELEPLDEEDEEVSEPMDKDDESDFEGVDSPRPSRSRVRAKSAVGKKFPAGGNSRPKSKSRVGGGGGGSAKPSRTKVNPEIDQKPIYVHYVRVKYQYIVSREEAARLTHEEKCQPVSMPIRWLVAKRNFRSGGPGQPPGMRDLFVVAKDIATLIHKRRGSIAKCWGKNTKMMLYDGRTKLVQQIVAGDVLMGDDGTPRTVQADSLIRGHTARDGQGAATYRVTSHNAGKDSWTCNGDHILVVRFHDQPSSAVMQHTDAGSSNPAWRYEQLETDENNVVNQRSYSFATAEEAEEARQRAVAAWRPLVWQGSVAKFLTFSKATQASAMMFQPDAPLQFHLRGKSLQQRLTDAYAADGQIGRKATAEEAELTAWVIGMWLTNGDAGKSAITHRGVDGCDKSPTPIVDRLKVWSELVHRRPAGPNDVPPPRDVQEEDAPLQPIAPGRPGGRGIVHFKSTSGGILKHILLAYKMFHEKSIPHPLLADSPAVRLQLLTGVVDGDGHANQTSRLVVVTGKERHVLDGLVHLSRGLGYSTGAVEKTSCTNNETGEVYEGFRVHLGGANIHLLATAHASKRIAARPDDPIGKTYPSSDGFTIRKVAHAKYYGFTLDGNGRCLLGDFTVTHNSIAPFHPVYEKSRVRVYGCRSPGKPGTQLLTVLSMRGVERFMRKSRFSKALDVWKWTSRMAHSLCESIAVKEASKGGPESIGGKVRPGESTPIGRLHWLKRKGQSRALEPEDVDVVTMARFRERFSEEPECVLGDEDEAAEDEEEDEEEEDDDATVEDGFMMPPMEDGPDGLEPSARIKEDLASEEFPGRQEEEEEDESMASPVPTAVVAVKRPMRQSANLKADSEVPPVGKAPTAGRRVRSKKAAARASPTIDVQGSPDEMAEEIVVEEAPATAAAAAGGGVRGSDASMMLDQKAAEQAAKKEAALERRRVKRREKRAEELATKAKLQEAADALAKSNKRVSSGGTPRESSPSPSRKRVRKEASSIDSAIPQASPSLQPLTAPSSLQTTPLTTPRLTPTTSAPSSSYSTPPFSGSTNSLSFAFGMNPFLHHTHHHQQQPQPQYHPQQYHRDLTPTTSRATSPVNVLAAAPIYSSKHLRMSSNTEMLVDLNQLMPSGHDGISPTNQARPIGSPAGGGGGARSHLSLATYPPPSSRASMFHFSQPPPQATPQVTQHHPYSPSNAIMYSPHHQATKNFQAAPNMQQPPHYNHQQLHHLASNSFFPSSLSPRQLNFGAPMHPPGPVTSPTGHAFAVPASLPQKGRPIQPVMAAAAAAIPWPAILSPPHPTTAGHTSTSASSS